MNSKQKLISLLQHCSDFKLRYTRFHFLKYLSNGYDSKNEGGYIHFIRSGKHGILYDNEVENCEYNYDNSYDVYVYHNSKIKDAKNQGDGPQNSAGQLSFCSPEYFTDDKTNTHVKLIEQEYIFEDHVHSGGGFIIENKDIDELFDTIEKENVLEKIRIAKEKETTAKEIARRKARMKRALKHMRQNE